MIYYVPYYWYLDTKINKHTDKKAGVDKNEILEFSR